MKTITVTSSQGSLSVDSVSGDVLHCFLNSDGMSIDCIVRFDFEEFKQHYSIKELPATIDILDLGYWLDIGVYEKPASDWRNMIRDMWVVSGFEGPQPPLMYA